MFLCRAVYVLKPLRLAVKNCLPRILSLEFLNRLSADCTKREPLQYRGDGSQTCSVQNYRERAGWVTVELYRTLYRFY